MAQRRGAAPEVLTWLGDAGHGDRLDVNIMVREADVVPEGGATTDEPGRRAYLSVRRELVAESQAELFAVLQREGRAEDSPVRSFWVNNAIAAALDADAIRFLMQRDDVLGITVNHPAPREGVVEPEPEPEGEVAAASHFDTTGAHRLWNEEGLRGDGVLVAVIDSGIAYDHCDLAPQMWDGGTRYPNHGWNFEHESNETDPYDGDGHGTACAGLIAGSVTGVAPGASLMALRVGDDQRMAWAAFEFAIQHKADIVSMSATVRHSSCPDYDLWRRACDTLLSAGIVHVNSTGNEGDQSNIPHNIGAPGNCPPPWLHPALPMRAGRSSTISIGAVNARGHLLSMSGRGPSAWASPAYGDYPYDGQGNAGLVRPDLCGPGYSLSTCYHEFGIALYRQFMGTSAAAAVVAGCFALLCQARKRAGRNSNPSALLEAMEMRATWIPGQASAKENNFGAGSVAVDRAFEYGRANCYW